MNRFEEYTTLSATLSDSALFSGVDFAPLKHILSDCQLLRLNVSERLIERGVADDSLFIVLEGALEVHVDTSIQDPIAIVGPGDSVGEMSAVDRQPRSATVVAKEPSIVIKIDSSDFWRLLSLSHQIALNMLHVLGERLRGNNAKIVDTHRLQEMYRRNASTDPLTQLYNRRGLDEIGKRLLTRLSRREAPLSLIMIDVDHFKRFNDDHGHAAGDFVLFAVGNMIKNCVRPTDFVARYGGEEFTVLLPDTTIDGALVAAERVREGIKNARLIPPNGTSLPSVTASFGVSQYRKDQELADLIAEADRALYEAKRGGRNRVIAA